MNDLIIVSSHYNEEISWIEKSGIDYLVVSKSKKNLPIKNFEKIENVGAEEFRSYIHYILTRWNEMPEYVGFIHGHENSFHQQFSMSHNFEKLKKIKLKDHFYNLNGDIENHWNSKTTAIYNFEKRNNYLYQFKEMWNYMNLNIVMTPPSFVCFPPSSQCIVKSETIKRFPKSFWQHIFNVLSYNDNYYQFSMTLEIAWPMLLGVTYEENHPFKVPEFYDYYKKNNLVNLLVSPELLWFSDNDKHPPEGFRSLVMKKTNSKQDWIKETLMILNNFKYNQQNSTHADKKILGQCDT